MKLRGRCILSANNPAVADNYPLKRLLGTKITTTAHRVAWLEKYGLDSIPEGKDVLHLCDVLYAPGDTTYRRCINTDHLFLGTDADNSAHMHAVGRAPDKRGEANVGTAKLTDEDVMEIRRLYVKRYGVLEALARRFNVTRQNIFHIVRRKTWTHLP